LDKCVFNEKTYCKIDKEVFITLDDKAKAILGLNILYYKNNGYILINENKLQTWDKNCYYKRYGYINLHIFLTNPQIKVCISQEQFDTSACKHEVNFPKEKYLWLSEIIISDL
jgi:hypothetical protein